MHLEVTLADSREFPASQLKRGIILSKGYARLKVEPDQSVSHLYSGEMRRLALGREAIELYKVQAGVVVPQRPRDPRVRVSPESVEMWSQEPVQVSQSLRLVNVSSAGYSRAVRLSNRSDSPLRLRVVSLHDPTSMNFRREKDPPGEIGVNAFNRGDHVVMDDVGDTTGVRVIGFSPRPSAVYMTKDRQKALDLMSSGELPDSVAGMSGAIIILTQWDFDLSPGGRVDLRFTSLHHPSSLEVALSELTGASSLQAPERAERTAGPLFASSVPSANFAFAWARAALDSIEGEEDPLDRLASGFGLQLLRGDWYEKEFDAYKRAQKKDGLLAFGGPGSSGALETSLFIAHAAGYALAKGEKKLAKKWYPALRRAGVGLQNLAKDGPITSGGASPEGWRRRLPSGFPGGVVAEVNLIACRALNDLAQLAYMVGKGADSAGFTESRVKLLERVNGTLRDVENGGLALNLDVHGRLHKELTIDQVVALTYHSPDANLASSLVHRLLDADFETGFGPRTVPTTNALYYNPTYGDGQWGGSWTRAAISHALLAYLSGYPSIGSLQLDKVARLVQFDCEKMGGIPGEFPYWLDPEKKTIGGAGSDPVAASRFLEALLFGELGLQRTPKGLRVSPPKGSRFRWMLFRDLALGGKGSLFIGRSASSVFSASSHSSVTADGARTFSRSGGLETQPPVEGLVFWDDSTVLVCLGNTAAGDVATEVSVPVKGKPIERSLYVDVEEFNPESSAWQRVERKRVLESVQLRTDLRSGSWKWFRLAQIT